MDAIQEITLHEYTYFPNIMGKVSEASSWKSWEKKSFQSMIPVNWMPRYQPVFFMKTEATIL